MNTWIVSEARPPLTLYKWKFNGTRNLQDSQKSSPHTSVSVHSGLSSNKSDEHLFKCQWGRKNQHAVKNLVHWTINNRDLVVECEESWKASAVSCWITCSRSSSFSIVSESLSLASFSCATFSTVCKFPLALETHLGLCCSFQIVKP